MLSDMWNAEKRGRAVAIYSLAPLLGPSVGPIAGGFIAEKSTWRWVFWSVTIADAVVQLGGLFWLQESAFSSRMFATTVTHDYIVAYAPVLLERKAKQLMQQMDPEKGQRTVVRTVYQTEERT